MSDKVYRSTRSPRHLGDAIARLRVERDLTQDELATLLGISRRYIYEIESGKPNLYAQRLYEVLRILGARLDLVIEDADA